MFRSSRTDEGVHTMVGHIPVELLTALRKASSIAILTGAGISAESQLPTFREAMTGLWATYKPEELATPAAFARNPGVVWDWYAYRRTMCAQAVPNPGHVALAELERRVAHFTLMTQNVDGLHQRAGSYNVLELHGSIARVKCAKTGCVLIGEIPAYDRPPPLHPETGGMLRPDVVWFGEWLPSDVLAAATTAAASSEIFFSIGTSAVVYPAAGLPSEALRAGALFVEINPEATAISSSAHFSLRGKSGEILPALLERM
jgi:NAD-dependent deacetylase